MEDERMRIKIKQQMKSQKMSYRKIARRLGISHGYLYDMLNGRRTLSQFYIIKIIAILSEQSVI